MTTTPFRFTAQVDSTGAFVSGTMHDQATFVDPITDEVRSTGVVVIEWPITAEAYPALFAALNAVRLKAGERIQAERDRKALVVEPIDVDDGPMPREPR